MIASVALGSSLFDGVVARHPPSVARAITVIESRLSGFDELVEEIWSAGGRARLIGITGPPGTGKSTLTNALVKQLRCRGRTIGVVAVDPSSALTGGAILGDRIRMADLNGDDGVFVRSLSSRGSLGGISSATVDVAAVLDAAGYDDVVIETVGAGQADVDIVGITETVIVVSAPGLGDDIQMIKAGLFELADLHVVNKSDRPDARRTALQISSMLTQLSVLAEPSAWHPPVIETTAPSGTGVDALAEAIDDHGSWLRTEGRLDERLRRAASSRIRELAKEMLISRLHDPSLDLGFADAVDDVASRRTSPHAAAARMLGSAHTHDREVST
jgi:LAO/AO transport system kinase